MTAEATWGRMRTFLAVAEHGSIRAAAGALHVTEPAVSTAVTALEKQLGAELVRREGRGVRITEAGAVYAGYCRTILGLLEESRSAVQRAGHSRLRIGAVETAGESLLPGLLASFVAAHPGVELSLSVLPRDALFDQLVHHQCDLVVAGRPPAGSGLVSRARRANRLVVVAAPSHQGPPAISTWLLRGPGSGTRETCLALLERLQLSPPTLTLGTHGAVVAAAREGLGLTLVHADAVEAELSRGTLVTVAVPSTPLNRPWQVSTTAAPPPSVAVFLRHISDPEMVLDRAFHLENRPHG